MIAERGGAPGFFVLTRPPREAYGSDIITPGGAMTTNAETITGEEVDQLVDIVAASIAELEAELTR